MKSCWTFHGQFNVFIAKSATPNTLSARDSTANVMNATNHSRKNITAIAVYGNTMTAFTVIALNVNYAKKIINFFHCLNLGSLATL